MNESWKRLIEVERRLAALDTSIYRTNQSLLRSSAAIRNDAMNVPDPFGTGGGGGGGTSSMVRFPTSFTVRVTWTVAPTLKSGASQNVAADGPEFASALSDMESGFHVNKTLIMPTGFEHPWYFDSIVGKAFQRQQFGFDNATDQDSALAAMYTKWTLNKYVDGLYAIDYDAYEDRSVDIDVAHLSKGTGSDRFYLACNWPRRDGLGYVIGYGQLIAVRTYTSTDTFSTGPKYGEHGTWSFAMECPATTYHNAGSGTIYLDW